MEALYELVIGGEGERVVSTAEPVGVGDALAIGDEVWLVLSESERPARRGSARFECRRAFRLPNRAHELTAYAKALRLDLTQARPA